jgi:hypothetical protein
VAGMGWMRYDITIGTPTGPARRHALGARQKWSLINLGGAASTNGQKWMYLERQKDHRIGTKKEVLTKMQNTPFARYSLIPTKSSVSDEVYILRYLSPICPISIIVTTFTSPSSAAFVHIYTIMLSNIVVYACVTSAAVGQIHLQGSCRISPSSWP